MKKEWQVESDFKSFPPDIEGIVIGDEGCIHRALDSRWISWVKRAQRNGLTVRYLTPLVPNKYIEELFYFILQLTMISKVKVTFNDYGMLARCRELIEQERIIPVVGRIITRSITDCPWYEELLKHEKLDLAAAVVGNNLVHAAKWEVLQKYKVREVEVNMHQGLNLTALRENTPAVTCYASNILVSVGRVCYSARWQGMKLPDCCKDSRCRTRLSIQADKTWGKMKLMFEEPSDLVRGKYQNLFVCGNVVYSRIPEVLLSELESLFDFQIF